MSLKNDILSELERNRGADVSGQALAEKLGVSRNAVCKAVAALKTEGFEVAAGTNRGYRLEGDAVSEAGIRVSLPEKYREMPIFVLSETDSTNNEAKRRLAAGLSGNALVAADRQTAGRGRRGRSFWSPPGAGAYMTLVINVDAELSAAVSVTTMAATAAARAIERLTGLSVKIKWVNDLCLNGKKICGILTEAVSDFETGRTQSVIIGIGVNMTTEAFPEELRETAGALGADGVTRNALIAAVAGEVLELSSDLSDRSYLDEYRERSLVIGRDITVYHDNREYEANVTGIDDAGGLTVKLPDGSVETLRSGEITIRLTK